MWNQVILSNSYNTIVEGARQEDALNYFKGGYYINIWNNYLAWCIMYIKMKEGEERS